jgi:hypothetical protein
VGWITVPLEDGRRPKADGWASVQIRKARCAGEMGRRGDERISLVMDGEAVNGAWSLESPGERSEARAELEVKVDGIRVNG